MFTLLTVAMCVLARAEACNIGQALLKKKYMVSMRGCGQQEGTFGEGKDTMDTLYRLLEDDPHAALNAGQTATCSPIKGRSGPVQGLDIHTSHSRFTLISVLQGSVTPVPCI